MKKVETEHISDKELLRTTSGGKFKTRDREAIISKLRHQMEVSDIT
jgi:hypothetical protein